MHNKLKILLTSPYLPADNTSACARKIYDSIVLLEKRGYSVSLFSFCSELDKEKIDAIKKYCRNFSVQYIKDYFSYPRNSVIPIRREILRICKNEGIDILQCEKAYMSRYLPINISIPCVLVEHEILSASFFQNQRIEKNPVKKVFFLLRGLKKYFEEKKWYKKFDKIIVFTRNDQDTISRAYNIKSTEVIPLGINLEDYILENKEKTYDIIFVGNFSHPPNVDAVLYFSRQIFPLIKDELLNVSVLFAGAYPPESIKRLAQEKNNFIVSGFVEDIKKYYYQSRVFIAPIRYGTGMRFKILEAAALGVPVVTTSIGARGILMCENIKIADTAQDFAKVVIELLKDQNKNRSLRENARLGVEKNHNLDILLDKYEAIYYNLVKKF